jgi:poly(3-hydroxybutyrate) depolymerase
MRRLRTVLAAYAIFGGLLLVSPLLLVLSRTWRGRFHGLAAAIQLLFLASVVVVAVLALAEVMPHPWAALLPASFVLMMICTIPMIRFRRLPDWKVAPVGSYYCGSYDPNRFGWDDIEDEQMRVIVHVATRLAVWLPAEERRAARREMLAMVDEMQAGPDYLRLPRITSTIGRTFLQGQLDPQHCYTFQPEPRSTDERFGMLLILHGHGPNWLILLHALRPLAERHRLVLVAPSFGYGNWEAPGGVEAIRRSREFALREFPVNPGRVFLAGFSQGGEGVGRAAAAEADKYAGVIFVSAVVPMPMGPIEEIRVLAIHGERDHHVRLGLIRTALEEYEMRGLFVSRCFHPGSDHFLLFAKRSEVLNQISEWLVGIG